MADISKIKLPDNSVYDLAVYTNHIKPVYTKTFTNVYCSANDDPNAYLYFGRFIPTNADEQAYIKFKVTATMAGVSNNAGGMISTVEYCTYQSSVLWWQIHNGINNGTYRNWYNHCVYRATAAGINNGYGHLLGFRFYSSYNPQSSTYARTITIDIVELHNATFSFEDSMILYSNASGTGSTNYAGRTEYDGTSQGDKHTGDNNDVNYYNREYYSSRTTTAALYRYQVCLTKSNGALVPVNSVNNSVATNKTLTTDTFDPFGEIFFWNTTNTYSANANIGNNALHRQFMADLRYSFNCGGYNTAPTLTARSPLYLVATLQSDGSAKLHSAPLAQALPSSDDGLIYIYLGRVYEDSKPYRVVLTFNHPVYWYKNGAVRLYNGSPIASTSDYGITKLSTATNSTATNLAATPSAVKTAYDLANTANGTANSALSGVNGNLIYDQTFTISNGVATFAPHVYQKGTEVTTNYAKSCFVWKYRTIDGTEVSLTTNNDRGCTVTISGMGYGGHVIGIFTPA